MENSYCPVQASFPVPLFKPSQGYSVVLTALHVFNLTNADCLFQSGRNKVTREGRKSQGMEQERLGWMTRISPFERALILQWGQDLGTLPRWRKSPAFLSSSYNIFHPEALTHLSYRDPRLVPLVYPPASVQVQACIVS